VVIVLIVSQFVLSRSSSPILAKPIPQRKLSKEFDLDASSAQPANGSANGKKVDIIQRLEDQADEM
jgi:hypothetical protein